MQAEAQETDTIVSRSIELMADRGYEATTVETLADGAGISRSTFFRKFGSKDDLVFADHAVILERARGFLANSTGDPLAVLADATLLIFGHFVRNPRTSIARQRLLQQVPSLRDRELVTSHRYERLFTEYLQAALPDTDRRELGAVALSAGTVAIHNAFLRRWLRAPDRDLSAGLAQELRKLSDTFRPALLPGDAGRARTGVVVAVFGEDASEEQILETVRSGVRDRLRRS
ncbi:TetR family transcriptional regulator [Paenarthrobacter sp. DKR-5]|uniref:TetR/AcrR family transcriptional regulator n=1 Tax=Paenarthrobacter sp. DKR-5 TaxID=2835535 RepID=UPI001BDC43BE|nr:TetR/AcrR family transcriptional regulator [Paenarthrobacter sp. DKR-5]MBT1002036.1 TetR family transcriptional regulator [Paenarthrobacter sp. DKR-5]